VAKKHVFGSEAKLAGKGCQTYALWVGNPFSFFVCRETKISSFYCCRFWFRSLVPNKRIPALLCIYSTYLLVQFSWLKGFLEDKLIKHQKPNPYLGRNVQSNPLVVIWAKISIVLLVA